MQKEEPNPRVIKVAPKEETQKFNKLLKDLEDKRKREQEEFNKQNKHLIRFLVLSFYFVLPIVLMLVIGMVSVKLEGSGGGADGTDKCIDQMGSYDC